MRTKQPTLSDKEITDIALVISAKYIETAQNNINNKKYPPNIYTFNTQHFRELEGHDVEWYNVFHAWGQILKERGWKCKWMDEEYGEAMMPNFQYYSNVDLETLGIPRPKLTIDFSKLSGYTCSQLGLVEYE